MIWLVIPFKKDGRKSCTDTLTPQVCICDITINETSLTNIADETRILTKVMLGLDD
jgi:hypothetical protein